VGAGHEVTITAFGRSETYDVLRSLDEIQEFALFLERCNANDIAIDGQYESDRIMEKAIAAVFANAVASLPDDHTKPPFLVMTLWEIRKGSYSDFSSVMYCFDRIHEIAHTSFDTARLLLLSQCDPGCPDDFVPLPSADREVIDDAIQILAKEKNAKIQEARELLRRLSASGYYESVLRNWNLS
jgi:hypothetical protein